MNKPKERSKLPVMEPFSRPALVILSSMLFVFVVTFIGISNWAADYGLIFCRWLLILAGFIVGFPLWAMMMKLRYPDERMAYFLENRGLARQWANHRFRSYNCAIIIERIFQLAFLYYSVFELEDSLLSISLLTYLFVSALYSRVMRGAACEHYNVLGGITYGPKKEN